MARRAYTIMTTSGLLYPDAPMEWPLLVALLRVDMNFTHTYQDVVEALGRANSFQVLFQFVYQRPLRELIGLPISCKLVEIRRQV